MNRLLANPKRKRQRSKRQSHRRTQTPTAPQAEHPQPSQKTEATDQPPPTPAIDYSLIQSIINDDSGSESPLGTETEQNTGPHNTVFDNKFRQYLHSEELKEFNRRRESVDIGNYNDGTAEHFSDGNGHCFKVIDNAGETMWVRKNCLKKQKRELEFGRLKAQLNDVRSGILNSRFPLNRAVDNPIVF